MSGQTDFDIGIVGTGFAGLVAALQLKKSGSYSFVMFERAEEVGGTWRDNVYPGCACDVASQLYSFAGEPNPDWSREYATQPEILAYIKEVVEKRDLRRHIRFDADVVEASFLEEEGRWQLRDRQGRITYVRVLLLGLGPLNRPHLPRLEGLEVFQGHTFHSSQWDAAYELKGKRVAVIGTGASAIQIVPAIAPEVAHLKVLQRTPPWVAHRFDGRISPASQWLYRQFPALMKLKRRLIFWQNEFIGRGFVGNERMNRLMAWLSLRKLTKEVKDPGVRRMLQPNYKIGCKRILRSDDYYPTFNRPNVTLVPHAADRFTQKGIVTADGVEHTFDAVIFATGFVAADMEVYTTIRGLGGRSLEEEWCERGAEAYLGTTLARFPNLAFLLGPNTGLGHNSVVLMMEAQMQYLLQYIDYLLASGPHSYLTLKPEVQQAYNQRIQQQFEGTVWASGCQSWYLNRQGKNTTLYPRLVVDFQQETHSFKPEAYSLVRPTPVKKSKESTNV